MRRLTALLLAAMLFCTACGTHTLQISETAAEPAVTPQPAAEVPAAPEQEAVPVTETGAAESAGETPEAEPSPEPQPDSPEPAPGENTNDAPPAESAPEAAEPEPEQAAEAGQAAETEGGDTAAPDGAPEPETEPAEPIEPEVVREENIVNVKKTVTYEILTDTVTRLVENYPEILVRDSIGTSVMGRDLILIKMGTGEKNILLVGGIHAREHITVAYVLKCMEDYAAAWASEDGMLGDYNIRSMLEEYTLWLVPDCNPDGTEAVLNRSPVVYTDKLFPSSMKANANGVNLNRNFPFIWDKATNKDPAPSGTQYVGPSAGSEPETQALMAVSTSADFLCMLSFHTKGQVLYWRDKTNDIIPGDEILAKTIAKVGNLTLAHRSWDTGIYCGGFENWFRAETGNPGLCVELMNPIWEEFVTSATCKNFNGMMDYSKTKFIFASVMQLLSSPEYPAAQEQARIDIANGVTGYDG